VKGSPGIFANEGTKFTGPAREGLETRSFIISINRTNSGFHYIFVKFRLQESLAQVDLTGNTNGHLYLLNCVASVSEKKVSNPVLWRK
jgi:hypothetical protein